MKARDLHIRTRRAALLTSPVFAIVMFAGCFRPAQAQTYPVRFPAPTTFTAVGHCCPSVVAVATGDFNGDHKLDVVNLDSGSDLNVMLGNGDGTFQTPISTYIGQASYFYDAIAVGDFNGDGHLDAALWALDAGGNTEADIYLGNGTGGLAFSGAYVAPNSGTSNPGPNSIVAADVNGDGKLDLVGLTPYNGAFVFLGNGDGSFQTPAAYTTGTTAGCCSGLAVGDLNSDGKLDLAISANDGISILLNAGSGTFGAATYYPSGVAGSATGDGIAIGDLNGDKKPDVVVTNENSGVIIYLNQGSGTFAESSTITNGVPESATDNVLLADINGDKKLDVIFVDIYGDVFTCLGKGTGAFSAATAYPLQAAANGGVYQVALADFNGDGALDLLDTDGNTTNTVSLGRGDGTFQTNQLYNYNTNISAQNIAVADFNGDGFPDVAESLQCCNNKGDIGIVLGSSHGSLSATTSDIVAGCANYNTVQWVATADVNGDGKTDVVATLLDSTQAGCQNNKVAVLIGKGTGKFNPPAYYSTGA
ncbi:MAG TPA: VCBS repeat-containing protein, partial [Terriglobia bacterium]|nr:VCBS repeat-containing protein [Terriglobia bacterium]